MTRIRRLTLLGTGSSGGVPRPNGDWGACDPDNPRNRRRRCSALIEGAQSLDDLAVGDNVTRVVIDTSPDFREQMLGARVRHLDAVLMTHDHADQTHGLDDVRTFALSQRQRIPVWMDDATAETLLVRFGYTFVSPPGSGYPPIFDRQTLPDFGEPITIEGPGGPLTLTSFDQEHGRIRSRGFRVGDIAYSADISGLPTSSEAYLAGVRCWAVDALRHEPHPTHFHTDAALDALKRVGAEVGVLTNLHITLDYDALSRKLPEGVVAGYDGLRITQIGDSEVSID